MINLRDPIRNLNNSKSKTKGIPPLNLKEFEEKCKGIPLQNLTEIEKKTKGPNFGIQEKTEGFPWKPHRN